MVFSMYPLRLTPNFPTARAVFYGSVIDESTNGKGHVAMLVSFPGVNQRMSLVLDDAVVWNTYVPDEKPRINKLVLDFKTADIVARKNTVLDCLKREEDPKVDVLKIEGGPILFYDSLAESSVRQSSLLYQAFDMHSRLIRKKLKSFEETDYRAAREALISLNEDYEQALENGRDFEKIEQRMKEAYQLVMMNLISVQN